MRVLLFGVDGLTDTILEPLMERGHLPNFQRVRSHGAHGILRSTVPPMTPPAWVSMSTGLKPAKHGVFDFWHYEWTDDGPHARVLTHRRGGRAIWNVLSDWGKRVIVANIPMTFPPEPVNGILLSGYMAPDMNASVTYPAGFRDELLGHVPDYQIDLTPAVSGGQIGDPLADTLAMTRGRLAMLRLILPKLWDFLFIGFSGADRIQHLRWDEILAFDPRAVEYYAMVDEALGWALEELHDDDLLMIVSDHGFQGVRRKFYLHEYLYREGYVQMRDAAQRRRARLLGQARGLVRATGMQHVARRVRASARRAGMAAVEQESHPAKLPDLDWSATRASVPSSSGSIAGYADIVLSADMTDDDIMALEHKLRDIRDPESGRSLAAEIYREEAFGVGPYAPSERHLVVLATPGIMIPTELGRASLWETSDVSAGIHHPDGVLALYGCGVKAGANLPISHLCDVAPTIYARMGIPLPHDLDGSAVEEAFEPLAAPSDLSSVVMRKLSRMSPETP